MNITKESLWKRKYIDLWSIPHTFFGIVALLFFNQINLDLFIGLFLTIILAILWEIFEYFQKWDEFFTNRISDVIIAIIGYTFSWTIIKFFDLTKWQSLLALVICFFIFSISNIIGWLIRR